MLDHVSLQVKDFAQALSFYTETLEPLGYVPRYIDEAGKSAGFGMRGGTQPWFARGSLWIAEGQPAVQLNLALRSPSREAVARFHAAALRAGAKDNGAPGVRADYHANYYAAFVLDPDGNNLEALTHDAV